MPRIALAICSGFLVNLVFSATEYSGCPLLWNAACQAPSDIFYSKAFGSIERGQSPRSCGCPSAQSSFPSWACSWPNPLLFPGSVFAGQTSPSGQVCGSHYRSAFASGCRSALAAWFALLAWRLRGSWGRSPQRPPIRVGLVRRTPHAACARRCLTKPWARATPL
jgi:hypothetical protein